MSVKQPIHSLCKFYSFYEEFLDETDVDSYFYHNIFDISQSHCRIVRISRGSNKKSFAIKLLQFCDLKTQQRYILQKEVNLSWKELRSLVDSLHDFLKFLMKPSIVYRFHYQNQKVNLDLQNEKKLVSLLDTVRISLNIQIANFLCRSDSETTILAPFP